MASSKRKKKSMQTALYGKIKETKGEWFLLYLTLPFNCSNTTQNKTKACKARINNW